MAKQTTPTKAQKKAGKKEGNYWDMDEANEKISVFVGQLRKLCSFRLVLVHFEA